MKIQIDIKSDSHNTYTSCTMQLEASDKACTNVNISLSGEDRVISVNTQQLRRALRALQDYSEGEY